MAVVLTAALMAVVLTAALLMPVTAHTVEQLQDWETDWQSRAVGTFDMKLLEEWRDMRTRHPWFYAFDEVAISTARVYVPRPARPPNPGVEQWRALVAHFWPAEHVDRMLRIMACESGGNSYAFNPSGATGLFQIMPSWQRVWPGDYTDPWTNAAVAYQIWLSQGYAAWVCSG